MNSQIIYNIQQLIIMSSQNIKFKIKEFQWFEMQTKVRQIIQEILGPIQKRVLENSSIMNRVKFNQGQDSKKIQQLTMMVENDPKVFETGIFASVDQKFEQQLKKIEQLSRQIDEQNNFVQEKFKILDVRMEESSEVLRNVSSLRERVSKQVQIQNQNINTVRQNIEKMINDLNTDIKITRKQQIQNLEACEKADYLLNEKVTKNIDNIKNIYETLEQHRNLHKQEEYKLNQHSETLKNHTQEIEKLQESKKLTKKLNDLVRDLQNQIKITAFKLQTISPLITQAQISECLYDVMPFKARKKICAHEYKKYYKLNREALEKDYNQITCKFQGLQLLEKMQKRNTLQIIALKRKKLISMGIDIDHLTYEQRQNCYNEIVLQDEFYEEEEEIKEAQKIDEKQIIDIMNKQLKEVFGKLHERINIELNDSKKYLYGVDEEIKQILFSFEEKVQNVQNHCQAFYSDQVLQNKSFEEELKKMLRKFSEIQDENTRLGEVQKSFYNFSSLINHLQIQDEIDKQNISLMGVKEKSEELISKPSKNSIIQVDKKCFSCCGYPAIALNSFKMACLAYHPSTINIENQEYKREEILSITTNLLQRMKQTFSVQEVEKRRLTSLTQNIMEMKEYDEFNYGKEKLKTEVESLSKKTSVNRFRNMRKVTKYSASKKQSRSTTKYSTGPKEDLLTASNIFIQIRKKNKTFLQ